MKNFINIKDIPVRDLKKILVDAKKRKVKRKKLNYLEPDKDIPLKGRFLIQMFEKSSTRTRLSFYLAIRQLGGGALNLRKIIFDAKQTKKKRKKLNTLDVDKDNPLRGKLLVQMFEKSSTRTRLSFYLAIRQLGGGALTLRADELHFAKGESLPDTAKILSTYGNAFMLRTDSDQKLEEFKKHMTIPIINGLSPSSHPTQVLSDVFTVEEIKKKSISKLQICWIGDANNNVINSLIEASVKFSFKLNIGCPKQYEPNKTLLNWAKKNKGKIKIFYDSKKSANGSDVIFTDK